MHTVEKRVQYVRMISTDESRNGDQDPASHFLLWCCVVVAHIYTCCLLYDTWHCVHWNPYQTEIGHLDGEDTTSISTSNKNIFKKMLSDVGMAEPKSTETRYGSGSFQARQGIQGLHK